LMSMSLLDVALLAVELLGDFDALGAW